MGAGTPISIGDHECDRCWTCSPREVSLEAWGHFSQHCHHRLEHSGSCSGGLVYYPLQSLGFATHGKHGKSIFFRQAKGIDGCLMWLMLVDFCGPKSDPDADNSKWHFFKTFENTDTTTPTTTTTSTFRSTFTSRFAYLFLVAEFDPTFRAEVAMQGRQDRFLPSAVPVDFLRSADFFQFFWGLGEHQLGGNGRFFFHIWR